MTARKTFGTITQIMRKNIQIGRSGSLPALAHYRTTSCTDLVDVLTCEGNVKYSTISTFAIHPAEHAS
jgi:hypothetical protein